MRSALLSFALLLSTTVYAQSDFYTKRWSEVYRYEMKALPKSALGVVDSIYIKAKRKKNITEITKALLYQSKFALVLQEDAELTIIQNFKKEINTSKAPLKNILESMIARLYWQYFKEHRSLYYQRSRTSEKVNAADFRTWHADAMFNEIHQHFQNSLLEANVLQKIALGDINELLMQAEGSKTYRSTVYDLLTHNALDFYSTRESLVTKSIIKFQIKDTLYFRGFETMSLVSTNSLSPLLQALHIYKDLLAFHKRTKDTAAYVNLEIERLRFLVQEGVIENANELQKKSLSDLAVRCRKHTASTLADIELASILSKEGDDYKPLIKTQNRFRKQEALTICNKAIATFPKSEGAEKCEMLKQNILLPKLKITGEVFVPVNKPSRLLLNYSSIDSVSFSAFKITEKFFHDFYRGARDSIRFAMLDSLTPNESWNVITKDLLDYQHHTTEVVVPKLPSGRYIILARAKGPAIRSAKAIMAYANMQITDIVLLETSFENTFRYQVVDRNSGKPLEGADIHLENTDERQDRSHINQHYTSDKNGFIEIKRLGETYTNIVATVTYKLDQAIFGNCQIYAQYSADKDDDDDGSYTATCFLFSDRSIYRPGQTVYFKGILIKNRKRQSTLVTGQYVEIVLEDVNGGEVNTLRIKTNSFGSFSGEFKLPANGLTGEYTISADEDDESESKFYDGLDSFNDSELTISVEEYKRPTFEVAFKPINQTFAVNDTITVTGTAVAYSGSKVGGAKISYTVKRKVHYPQWYYWYNDDHYNNDEEIEDEEVTSDKNGEFAIKFNATPDETVSRDSKPVFYYEIKADVTDLNGETRSATTTVKVGYHTLVATLTTPAIVNRKIEDNIITITTENLNDQFVPAQGIIKIYKLKSPSAPVRSRPWDAPDLQAISEEEFNQLFPHDLYQNSIDSRKWENGKLMAELKFNTEVSKEVKLKIDRTWELGSYRMELKTTDPSGEVVTDMHRFTIIDPESKAVADNQLLIFETDKPTYKVGELAHVKIGSASPDITVTVDVEKNHTITKTYVEHLSANVKEITIPINETMGFGFAIHCHAVCYNAFLTESKTIQIISEEQHMEIETITFKDKLQPGSKETWSFEITGPDQMKKEAEVLASMYDASLDQFKEHRWSFNPMESHWYYSDITTNANSFYHHIGYTTAEATVTRKNTIDVILEEDIMALQEIAVTGYRTMKKSDLTSYISQISSTTNTRSDIDLAFNLQGRVAGVQITGLPGGSAKIYIRGMTSLDGSAEPLYIVDGVLVDSYKIDQADVGSINIFKDASATSLYGAKASNGVIIITTKSGQKKLDEEMAKVKARQNFNETAFFFPHLTTNENGQIRFTFTTPESLTRWKLQLLAYNRDLVSTTKTLQAVTQKELMVTPNPPRFLRVDDDIIFSTKIANLSSKNLQGKIALQLTNAVNGEAVDVAFKNIMRNQTFTLSAKGTTQVSWRLSVPSGVDAVQYKIVAKAGHFSDGEQNVLPVLSNRMLVTETLPMYVREGQTKTFTLEKLKTTPSSTLQQHQLTLEVTSNPAWYAVQSLPYLMEFPHECAEQMFSRYYANTLAAHVANSNPKIKTVFDKWSSSGELTSALEKNPALKSIVIQETPWVRDTQSETEQKKRMALLFNLNTMNGQKETVLNKLSDMQLGNGAFPWFSGGYESRYITQHIAASFGHLKHLNVVHSDDKANAMISKAINYLDQQILKDYTDLLTQAHKIRLEATNKQDGITRAKEFMGYRHVYNNEIHYLYMRSFYPDQKLNERVAEAIAYYQKQSAHYWKEFGLYMKGMIALIQYRNNNTLLANDILKSLKENSIDSDEFGMYWKENTSSWYWYEAPIETQALLIEAFSEINPLDLISSAPEKRNTVDELRIWLLKNKQTSQWKTTKETTEAIYALLLNGTDWLSLENNVNVTVGGKPVTPEVNQPEMGTGYFKTSWKGDAITPAMSSVTLTKKSPGIAWAGMHWQYFENLDKITPAETPLKLIKKVFAVSNTDKGELLTEVNTKTDLKNGDLLRIRIELKADREMEFLHMKDMRAAGLEPVDVLSEYKWQGGLGYYQSTKDASTNFFFDRIPKGVHVFEYDLRVNNKGNFSNGITTIQSMYAPEFSSHSEGIRIKVE